MIYFTLNRQYNAFVLAACVLLIGIVFIASRGDLNLVAADQASDRAAYSSGITSYLDSARQLLSQGFEAHDAAKSYSGLMANDDPRTTKMLRDTIERTEGC